MLPTLGFILLAYGFYALYRAWSRRHRRQMTPYRQWQRRRRITLVGGAGVGVGIIILICILGLPSRYDNLKIASIISTSWGYDALQPGQVMPRQEIMPLKSQGAPGQPVYAYLHPETPPAQLQANKVAAPSRTGKFHRLGKPVSRAKASKIRVPSSHKKSKASAKHRAKTVKNKKKKHNRPTRNLAANTP